MPAEGMDRTAYLEAKFGSLDAFRRLEEQVPRLVSQADPVRIREDHHDAGHVLGPPPYHGMARQDVRTKSWTLS